MQLIELSFHNVGATGMPVDHAVVLLDEFSYVALDLWTRDKQSVSTGFLSSFLNVAFSNFSLVIFLGNDILFTVTKHKSRKHKHFQTCRHVER